MLTPFLPTGLNRRVSLPVAGSKEATSEPLKRLQSEDGLAPVFFGNDVVNFKREKPMRLCEQAVFANAFGALANALPQGRFNTGETHSLACA
jgi:hypothetical protein